MILEGSKNIDKKNGYTLRDEGRGRSLLVFISGMGTWEPCGEAGNEWTCKVPLVFAACRPHAR
jgi:hypothetical protein